MTKLANRWLLASACAVVALAAPRAASAHGAAEEGNKGEPATTSPAPAPASPAPAPVPAPAEGAAAPAEHAAGANEHAEAPEADHPAEGGHHEEEETKLELALDFVAGFGKTDVVTSDLPGINPTVPTNTVDSAKMSTQSFLLSGAYELAHGFGVGLRLPFAMGTFTSPGHQSRATSAVGNLELEGEYALHLDSHMKLYFALGVALPTAQGDEVPSTQEEIDKLSGKVIDQNNFDRFSLNHAAAASRGYEENALFETKRLGFIPKVGLDYNRKGILFQPYVKMENLISTVSGAAHSYVGELVFGTFLGYRIHPMFDAGARVWGNVPLAGTDSSSVAVVEPQVRGHFGPLHPVIGGIIPFAGPLTSPQWGGLRFALAAKF